MDDIQVVYRRISPRDAQEFAKIRLRGLCEHPIDFGEDAAEFQALPMEIHQVRLEPRPDNAVVFGAFHNNQLVGIVGLYRREERRKLRHLANLFGLYVVPEHRRRGIGEALLRSIIRHAQEMTALEIIGIEVVTTNEPALRLYKKLGFVVWGTQRKGHLVGNSYYDLVHMDQDLKSILTYINSSNKP